jgi:hypothetical protein
MWVDLGIWASFVWEDVVDGSEGDHDQGEGGTGGVEPMGPVDDQADSSGGGECVIPAACRLVGWDLMAVRDAILVWNELIQSAKTRETHRRLSVALNSAGSLQRDGEGPVEHDLVREARIPRQSQHDQSGRRLVRRLPDGDAPLPICGLNLDLSTIRCDRVVPCRGCRDQPQIEERLGRCLSDGPHEMSVQGELPARMHLLQLLHDRVKLVDQNSCTRSPRPMARLCCTRHPVRRLRHALMMPRSLSLVHTARTGRSVNAQGFLRPPGRVRVVMSRIGG